MSYFAVDPQALGAIAPAMRAASLEGVDSAASSAIRAIAGGAGGGECAVAATDLAGTVGKVLGVLGDQLRIFGTATELSASAYGRVEGLASGLFGGAR
ncbi:hypothetical protein [Flexivirga meconopsidis]|uniref:hypothetical protein n=1 Tax=Flexivirga meconopsidis TaxID=2977121 RepID=UPI00223F3585|nr:hypothetical protein [Flexivirga meconopsidis]